MPTITFLPSRKTIDAATGTPLSEAARAAGVRIGLPCGGKGMCGRCLVRATEGGVQLEAGTAETAPGMVLACRARVADTALTVDTGAGLSGESGQFPAHTEDLRAVDEAFFPKDIAPPTQTLRLTVPPPAEGDGLSDLDRLRRALGTLLPFEELTLPPDILASLPLILREKDGAIHACCWRQGSLLRLTSLSAEPRRAVGLCADIGTTTVAAHLVNLRDGGIIASATAYNKQIDCGLDVISRIHYARDRERLAELQALALDSLRKLCVQMAAEQGIDCEDIVSAVLAGNTTMTHLLLGIVPEHIRLHPYTPAVYGVPVYTAGELGLNCINRHAPIHCMPSVGSYVGGDVVAGLLCTPLGRTGAGKGPYLYIDIGTNGEIVLGDDDYLLACACSAGPAFEGGGLRHGCRASDGAIERVTLNRQGQVEALRVIGGVKPKGICGSGAISLAAELFRNGLVDAAGHFTDGRKEFVVAEGDGARITFSESDLDNLLRAKAAVFSACRTLLNSAGLSFDGVERVYVAGGFGRYLDSADAAAIGLLPRLDGRSVFVGNASLSGAYMALCSADCRARAQAAANRITYIDLSNEASYMDEYMAALFLPHTTLRF